MNFDEFKKIRYSHVPGDFLWNEQGFKNNHEENIYSDISAHLPMLEFLASRCDHVTEFGTRDCYSTAAFIAGVRGKVVSYDLKSTEAVEQLLSMKDDLRCSWQFILSDTTNPYLKIEKTDLLFIDTLHTYNQVKQELKIHSDQVNKWIVFHDTFSQGERSLDVIDEAGILPAIYEFLEENNWLIIYEVSFNHGLMVIENLDN